MLFFLEVSHRILRPVSEPYLCTARNPLTLPLFLIFRMLGSLQSGKWDSNGIYINDDGTANPHTSIFSCFWVIIVTITTVGYGDISPQTGLGQFFASIIMILGYAIIAVPTGLISVELSRAENSNTQSCPSCSKEGHDDNAKFCKYCGADLGL